MKTQISLPGERAFGSLYLLYDPYDRAFAREGWKVDPFFLANPEAAKLYEAMGRSANWEYVQAGSIYDDIDPHTLGAFSFGIDRLGAEAEVEDPKKALEVLIGGGWFRPN